MWVSCMTQHGTIGKDPSDIWDPGFLISVHCTVDPSWYSVLLYCLLSGDQWEAAIPILNRR